MHHPSRHQYPNTNHLHQRLSTNNLLHNTTNHLHHSTNNRTRTNKPIRGTKGTTHTEVAEAADVDKVVAVDEDVDMEDTGIPAQ